MPPHFQEWQVVKEVAGNDVTLPCKFAKFPSSGETENPTVVWKRETENGVMLLKPDKHRDDQEENKTTQRIFWNTSPKEKDWAIKISQTREEDAGIYHCVITNTSQTLSVELEVAGTPFRHSFKMQFSVCLNVILIFCTYKIYKNLNKDIFNI